MDDNKKIKGFSDEEKAAMRERAKELKTEAEKAGGESDLLAKIAEMPAPDRVIAKQIHAIIKKEAPSLSPKTWYGMPAYANKDGKVVAFFRSADKFKERYAMLGFNDLANLDEGSLWPVAYALTNITTAEEARIAAIIRKAVSQST